MATWRLHRSRGRAEVAVHPFEPLDPDLVPLLAAEARDIGRFLDIDVVLAGDPAGSRACAGDV